MDVQSYFQNLVDAFVACAVKSGFKATTDRVVLEPTEHDGEACWKLSLKNTALILTSDVAGSWNKLTKKLGFEKGHLKILISPRETIKKGEPWNIKESAIELAYVARDLSKAESDLLLGVHCDFSVTASGEPRPAHPLFHAQLTSRLVKLNDLLGGAKADRMKCLPQFRLPTAHMSLPSVLLLVAADQFKEPQYLHFLQELRKAASFPSMSNTRFSARLDGSRMRSCAWYPN